MLFVSKATNVTSKVEIWEASATLAFIPVMILTRYDDGLVKWPHSILSRLVLLLLIFVFVSLITSAKV